MSFQKQLFKESWKAGLIDRFHFISEHFWSLKDENTLRLLIGINWQLKMPLYQIWVFIFNSGVVFKLIDNSSISIERLFSLLKRTMTDDRNRIGDLFLEAIMVCNANSDLMTKSKQQMLDHIYEMIISDD